MPERILMIPNNDYAIPPRNNLIGMDKNSLL